MYIYIYTSLICPIQYAQRLYVYIYIYTYTYVYIHIYVPHMPNTIRTGIICIYVYIYIHIARYPCTSRAPAECLCICAAYEHIVNAAHANISTEVSIRTSI